MLKLTTQPNLGSHPREVKLRPGDSVPNFAVPRNVVSQGFLANLKCLLTERGSRIPGGAQEGALLRQQFRASFADNLKECFRPAPKFTTDAVTSLRGAASPGIKIEPQPLYVSVFRNIRDVILPPKLPPLELTSKPVEVPELWSKQKAFSGSRAVSVFLHAVVIAAALVWSIRQVAILDAPKTATVLIAPPAPGAPPPPPAAAAPTPVARHVASTKRKSFFVQGKLTAPVAIPKIANAKQAGDDVGAPDLNLGGVPGGVPGGVLGGTPGGVPGGILGGVPGGPAPPSAPAPPPGLVRVGGDIKRPKEIYAPAPEFPAIARQAKVTGTVVLDAVIDEHGNVVKLRAVSGNGLLIGAAIKAVERWKYEPTYLNGVPVSVEMEVEVNFHLVPH